MKTTDADVNAALQRLDRALTPAPVLAAKAVAELRGRSEPTPWVKPSEGLVPVLDVDAVERGARPGHAVNVTEQRRRTLMRRLLFWR